MEVILTKTRAGLIPNDPQSNEWFNKLKLGADVHGDFRQYRNAAFHRKYFALLNVAFDHWHPGEVDSKHGKPEKNFDAFRRDLAILSGFYEVVIRLDGSTRIEAKSISFAKMDQEQFQQLYDKTITVLIKKVYGRGWTPEQVDELVEKYLRFA